jgi:NADH-quinone oxidoreductase subunit A
MIQQLGPVLVLSFIVIAFVVAMLTATFFAGPARSVNTQKQMPYECGVPGIEIKDTKFPIKFYLTAILFILFDIEVIFLYPWALIYKEALKFGPFIFVEMLVFVVVLVWGLFYIWKARALEWD